jgi:hypothetical protein
MLVRLICFLVIAATAVMFTLQNMSPVLSLMFLGMKTPALALSWWVLAAIAAGSLTTLAIHFLFRLSNFGARRSAQSQFRQAGERPDTPTRAQARSPGFFRSRIGKNRRDDQDDAVWQDWRGYEDSAERRGYEAERDRPSSKSATDDGETSDRVVADSRPFNPVATHADPAKDRPREESGLDDWEKPFRDDWGEEAAAEPQTPDPRFPASQNRRDPETNFADSFDDRKFEAKPFEAKQQPRHSSREGSVYSYTYRESRNEPEPRDLSGDRSPSRPQSVVDAEYRVLVPPYRPLDVPPTSNSDDNADDWFEDNNDEFEDSNTNRDRPPRR